MPPKYKPEKVNTKPMCIIPAKGDSERLRHKNKLKLGNKTLVEHAIEVALGSNLFQVIVVTSEDEDILETAYKYFNNGLVQPHRDSLYKNGYTLNHICGNVLKCYKTNATEICLLVPNSPFRTPSDLRKAYRLFRKEDANFLVSVKPYDKPPQLALEINKGFVKPKWGHKSIQNSQQLNTLYYEDGAFCFAKIEAFINEFDKNFLGSKCLPYILPYPTVDIDTKEDYECAKYLWEQFKR